MTGFVWEALLTETDREVIRRGGYGQRRGLGRRPALLLIDCQYNYLGLDKPILEQLDEYPAGVGEAAWKTVDRISRLAGAARKAGRPVIYTRQVQSDAAHDHFAAKAGRDPSLGLAGSPGVRIIEPLAPVPGDIIIDKTTTSPFFGTPLIAHLIRLRVDTLVIAGGSTSGCVRSAALAGAGRQFRVGVVYDGVFDRIRLSHYAALLDMWMKFADLLTAKEAQKYLGSGKDASGREGSVPSADPVFPI